MGRKTGVLVLTAFLSGIGKITLNDIAIPEPSKGELLIKVKTALTCGTDLKAYIRGYPLIPMPGPFGHEFSGVVEESIGVSAFKKGDEIMAVHTAPCLKCKYCKAGLYNLCKDIMDTKVIGAFSEYILLPAHIVKQNVFHKPKKVSFDEAAFLEPLSCVLHGMRGLDIKKGDRILIIGVGTIGLIHLLLLKQKRAIVAITDINKKRLKMAESLGADFAFMPQMADTKTKALTDGIGFDYIFECTGRPEVWESSISLLRCGGTLILFGGCPKGTKVSYDTERLHYDELTIKGVFHFMPEDVKKAYELICKGKLGLKRLISGRYPLKDIKKAFDRLKMGEGIKYAIIP
ncbi:MAG: zinc-binding dehydrogenase [Nitrospirae bacterium]|nr:zinc-binding dehydrogenase [Nitrospirota bacterium]